MTNERWLVLILTRTDNQISHLSFLCKNSIPINAKTFTNYNKLTIHYPIIYILSKLRKMLINKKI